MKENILIIIGAIYAISVSAKEPLGLDTIYANSNMNTALFFPADIRQGLVGSDNFVFSYNLEKGQNLGLLKATKGTDSNLLVITVDGRVYSFVLRYAENLESVNRFISISESIGYEKGITLGEHRSTQLLTTIPLKTVKDSLSVHDQIISDNKPYDMVFIKKSCEALLKRPERKNVAKRRGGISLAVKNLIYHEDLVYVQFEIKNNSGIDFNIEELVLSKVSGNSKQRSSFQEIPLKPIYTHNMPGVVRHGDSARFVYVLLKFTLAGDEKLSLNLKEVKGSRAIKLIRSF